MLRWKQTWETSMLPYHPFLKSWIFQQHLFILAEGSRQNQLSFHIYKIQLTSIHNRHKTITCVSSCITEATFWKVLLLLQQKGCLLLQLLNTVVLSVVLHLQLGGIKTACQFHSIANVAVSATNFCGLTKLNIGLEDSFNVLCFGM